MAGRESVDARGASSRSKDRTGSSGPATPPADPRIAGFGSRLVALVLDWLLSNLVALALFRDPAMYAPPRTAVDLAPLAVFAVEVAVLTALTGASAGQLIRGIAVARLDGQRMGAWRSIVRTALILLVIPPLVADGRGRGLHDKAVGTIVLFRRGERAKLPPA